MFVTRERLRDSRIFSPCWAQHARAWAHFIGFRGEEYWSAVKVWGEPDFYHIGWDLRAQRDIADGDTVVFAKGDADQQPSRRSFNDLIE